MGWIFSPATHHSITERVRADLDLGERFTVLDAKQVGRAVYSAVRRNADDTVFAVATLIEHRDGMIGLKHMDETMRPFADECPMRILRLLTPTTNPRALAWREACLAQHRDDPVYSSLAEGVGQ